MRALNKILKILLILAGIMFLYVFSTYPKTDCQSCQFVYDGHIIDGEEAFALIEKECISYDKPWDSPDISNIKLNETFINK